MSNVLPNFLIVGAQKCGTTSLHDILDAHPETKMSAVKEINYFINPERYAQGLSHYSTYFTNNQAKAIGESSPGYICHPGVAERIRRDLGQIKIIIILRNPINRAFSQYWDNRRHLSEWLTEKEIIDQYLESTYMPGRKGYFSRGVYAPQVEKYFTLFGRDSVKVVFLEEMVKNQSETLKSIYDFLGLSKDKGLEKLPSASNSSMVWSNPIYKLFRNRPSLNRFLPKHARRILFFGNQSKFRYELPNEELITRIKAFYHPHNEHLASLLGRPLPW